MLNNFYSYYTIKPYELRRQTAEIRTRFSTVWFQYVLMIRLISNQQAYRNRSHFSSDYKNYKQKN